MSTGLISLNPISLPSLPYVRRIQFFLSRMIAVQSLHSNHSGKEKLDAQLSQNPYIYYFNVLR